MNLAQTLAYAKVISAGGPGSGRHPEFGAMHDLLIRHGYNHHPSGNIRQDYIHPRTSVHVEVNPTTGGWRRAEYPDHEGGHGVQTLHRFLHGQPKVEAGGIGSGRHKVLWTMHDQLKDHPARFTDSPSASMQENYLAGLEKLYSGVAQAAKGHEKEMPSYSTHGNVGENVSYARQKLDSVAKDYNDGFADYALGAMHNVIDHLSSMAAGGPGSGCRGPNCGRPSSAGNRVGLPFPHRVRRTVQIDPKTKHVFDTYTRNGRLSALIPRSEYPLTQEQRAAEQRFSRMIGSNPQKYINAFIGKYGNSINADDAKELSPDYQKDRSTFAAAVHEPASWLVKQVYKQKLAEQPGKGQRNVVFFTAGAAGTGKTSAIKDDPSAAAALKNAHVVYDGTLRPATKAVARIQQALDAGKEAAVMFTYRDPGEAFRDGMLGRASRMEKDEGSGRVVTLNEMAHQHSSVQESMRQLVAKYKDNPKFSFGVIDNSYGKGQAKRSDLASLPREKTYDQLRKEFRGILDDEYRKGNITPKIYKAVLGSPGSAGEQGH